MALVSGPEAQCSHTTKGIHPPGCRCVASLANWGQVTLQEPSDENSNKGVEEPSALFKVMGRKREGPSQVPHAASAICISAAPSLQQGLLLFCTHSTPDPSSPLAPKHCCLLYNPHLHPCALQLLLPELSCISRGFWNKPHDATGSSG